MSETPIDDGGDKPLGYQTPDGELEVRDFVDNEGVARRGYCETELGQHQRWMRSAPELFELYQAALVRKEELDAVRALYNELLYAVEMKMPGLTRHQMALRLIVNAQRGDDTPKTYARP